LRTADAQGVVLAESPYLASRLLKNQHHDS
jgi:hypothetical protein